MKRLCFPLASKKALRDLKAGEMVLLQGVVLAARDQTHRLLLETYRAEGRLPVDLQGHCLYYVGPSPAPPGRVIGAAGPTTSYRMDRYTPPFLAWGVYATMGKGPRSLEVRRALKEHEAVYLATFGGAGAYLAQCIESCRVLAFPELGPEALLELKIKDFPAVVINDLEGRDFYEETRAHWAKVFSSEGRPNKELWAR